MPDGLSRRRSLFTVALVGALLPDTVPAARMVHAWLDTWTGIGHITIGMDRQGYGRMSELAAQLVDRVIPRVPVRQWVLSLPFTLRYQRAIEAKLTAVLLAVFIRSVFRRTRRAAAHEGIADAQGGAITLIQRPRSAFLPVAISAGRIRARDRA